MVALNFYVQQFICYIGNNIYLFLRKLPGAKGGEMSSVNKKLSKERLYLFIASMYSTNEKCLLYFIAILPSAAKELTQIKQRDQTHYNKGRRQPVLYKEPKSVEAMTERAVTQLLLTAHSFRAGDADLSLFIWRSPFTRLKIPDFLVLEMEWLILLNRLSHNSETEFTQSQSKGRVMTSFF